MADRGLIRRLREELPRKSLKEVVGGSPGVARTGGSGSLIVWRDRRGQGFMLANQGPMPVGDMRQLVPDGINAVAPSYFCGLGGNGCYHDPVRPKP